MRSNVIPILKKEPDFVILHVGTNDASNYKSREIHNKLLSLKMFITNKNEKCQVILSEPVIRTDNGISSLKVSKLINSLSDLNIPIISNRNIFSKHLGSRGLHLNRHGTVRLAMNLISEIGRL